MGYERGERALGIRTGGERRKSRGAIGVFVETYGSHEKEALA